MSRPETYAMKIKPEKNPYDLRHELLHRQRLRYASSTETKRQTSIPLLCESENQFQCNACEVIVWFPPRAFVHYNVFTVLTGLMTANNL